MVSSAGTSVFQKEWFRFEGNPDLPYMIPKAEYRDLIEQVYAEKRKQAIAEHDRFMEKVKQEGTSVQLTEDQKRELRESFDPKKMSWEEYQSLINQLCEYGILEESDKKFLHCGYGGSLEMTYVDPAAPLSTASLERASGGELSFSSWKGNALGWAKYLSGFQGWDEHSQSWQKTRESILFEKLRDILNAISK